jgi:hypothetical protein
VQDAVTQAAVEKRSVPVITTTLFDLIAARQMTAGPEEDAWVVAILDNWLRSGRIRMHGKRQADLSSTLSI